MHYFATFLTFLLTGVTLESAIIQAQTSDVPQEVARNLQSKGYTVEQAQQEAQSLGINLSNPQNAAQRARELGIPEAQIQQMLQAIESSQMAEPGEPPIEAEIEPEKGLEEAERGEEEPETEDLEEESGKPIPPARRLQYFGYNTFRAIPKSFQPSAVGPVDEGYLIGPQDELRLTLWGATEFQYDLDVDREGRIYVPKAGQLVVAGRQLKDLRREMKQWLSRSYAGLETDPPSVFMDLTITRLRSIRVFVLGEVARPGGYSISSYSTLFNVLYSVGGPLTRGSLRNIQVIRDGQVVTSADFYNYLLKGFEANPIRLQNNDHIFIPLRGKTVAISGNVRRQALYELKEDEGFSQLLSYAGGLGAEAYTKRFQIERIIPFEQRKDPSIAREVIDVDMAKVLAGEDKINLYDSDQVRILSILDILENVVTIEGTPVLQPGRYELKNSIHTVRDLIMAADGITGDVYMAKADLIRTKPDMMEELISLNLEGVFADVPTQNLPLRPLDRLRIYSIHELEIPRSVRITGKVRQPGSYALRDSMTIYDLLFFGGGLLDEEFVKDVFLKRADLYRRTPEGLKEVIIPFHLGEALAEAGFADSLLRPGDGIRVYPREVEVIKDKVVTIYGAVKQPGQYRLRENMMLEDIILHAGGFTENAYLAEAQVTRLLVGEIDHNQYGPVAKNQKVLNLTVPLASADLDTVSFALEDTVWSLEYARQFPLKHRDMVFIRTDPDYRLQGTVTITGEVLFPGEYTLLQENETLADIVRRAGGVTPTGYSKGGRLMRQGEKLITRFDKAIAGNKRANLILLPGDEIIIPPLPNTVAVHGNVPNTGLIKHEPNRRVSYYLRQAGGAGEETENILLTQASGATFKLRRSLLFQNRRVDDGAIITVTRKPEREEVEFDLGKTITDAFSLLASAATIVAIIYRVL